VGHGPQEHLTLLHQKYDHYFFTINTEQYYCIQNPFSADVQLSVNARTILPDRENFFEIRSDRTLRSKLSLVPFDEFSISRLMCLGFLLKKKINGFGRWILKFFFSFARHTCVNKVSHLSY